MGVLGSILGSNISAPIDAIGRVVGKVYTTEKERLEALAILEKIKQHPSELQIELNKISLQSPSWFISGWRSSIGWVGSLCMFIYYIPQFLIADFLWVKMCLEQNKILTFPIDSSGVMNIVYLLLGFGAYRSFDYRHRNMNKS